MSSEYSAHEAKRLAKQVLLQAHNGRLQYDIATGILLADTDKCEVLSIMELDNLLVRAAFLYHAALMDKAFYQWRAVRTTTAGKQAKVVLTEAGKDLLITLLQLS